jgi:hypothetical protein
MWNEEHDLVLVDRVVKKGDIRPVPICPRCGSEVAEEAR